MKRLKYILLLLLATAMMGCDITIHEYPDNTVHTVVVPFTLNLDFNTEMPLYKTQEHTRTRSGEGSEFDLRYIINIYKASQWRQIGGEVVKQFVFSKEDIEEWNFSTNIELNDGDYDIVVWADYVDAGTTKDKYYDTSDFSIIKIIGDIQGNTDFRDAFVGRKSITLTPSDKESVITVPMERPMAKYRFISTDLESFVSRMLDLKLKKQREEANRSENENNGNDDSRTEGDSGNDVTKGEEETKGDEPTKGDEDTKGDDDTKGDTKVTVDLEDYYIVFTYPNFVNISFDALMNVPAAPGQALSFRSEIKKLSETEAELGFDYIFVNGAEAKVEVSLKIYDKDDTEVGGVNGFFVDLSRSKLTEVRGKFLTSQESGGIGIDPSFDDEFNITIK